MESKFISSKSDLKKLTHMTNVVGKRQTINELYNIDFFCTEEKTNGCFIIKENDSYVIFPTTIMQYIIVNIIEIISLYCRCHCECHHSAKNQQKSIIIQDLRTETFLILEFEKQPGLQATISFKYTNYPLKTSSQKVRLNAISFLQKIKDLSPETSNANLTNIWHIT